MNTPVSSPEGTTSIATKNSLSDPLSSRALFWRPRYLKGSGFIHYLPFAFWLVDVCRPNILVDTGIQDGLSYFALCQAVDKLDIPARCWGFGDWETADQKKRPVPTELANYNADHYYDFSRIKSQELPGALSQFEDGTVDFLGINMAQPIAKPQGYFSTISAKMSSRGVVLLHGLEGVDEASAHHTLIKQITKDHEHVRFDDHTGALLVLFGDKQPDRLKQLVQLRAGSAELHSVQTVFSTLGARYFFEWRSNNNAEALRKANEVAAELKKETATQKVDLAHTREQLSLREEEIAATGTRLQRLNRIEVERHEAERDLVALRERLESQRGEIDAARAAFERELAPLRDQLASQKTELQGAGEAQRAAERALAQHKSEADAARAASERELIPLREQLASQKADLEHALEAQRAAETALAQQKTEADTVHAAFERELAPLREQLASQKADLEHALEAQRAAETALAQKKTEVDTVQAAFERELAPLWDQLVAQKAELERTVDALRGAEAALARTRLQADQRLSDLRKRSSQELQELIVAKQRIEISLELRIWQFDVASASRKLGLRRRHYDGDMRRDAAVVQASKMFDKEWYLTTYPDVAESTLSPAEHFLRHGIFEARDPSPDFDVLDYYRKNPEVLQARANALLHFEKKK